MTDARTIPCFPAPTADMVALVTSGRIVEATRAFKLVPATLWDGTVVYPNLKTAYTLMRAIKGGMPALGVAVEDGGYITQAQVDAEAAAAKLKSDRFNLFMEGDKPPMRGECQCDRCGTHGPCDNHYAPDAMGYPTLVLTINDCCKESE